METEELNPEADATEYRRTPGDLIAVAVSTCGVGFIPLAPGTWGSLLGVALYLGAYLADYNLGIYLLHNGWQGPKIESWLYSVNLLLLAGLAIAGIVAADRAAEVFGEKDPQKTVIDEVVGQLIVFLFIPFTTSWWLIGAGFLLFRIFDIVKPYPIKGLQDLPGGLGVCADDIAAGLYAGVTLNVIYSISLTI